MAEVTATFTSPSPTPATPGRLERSLRRQSTRARGQHPMDIFTACRTGNKDALNTALCSGVDPNLKSKGQTPLMYAAENGHPALCELLIQNGANVEALDSYHRTALHLATKNSHVDCARVLMFAGARTDVPSSLGGETPADIAHTRGVEMVRTVLYFKETNLKSIKDKTPTRLLEVKKEETVEKPAAADSQSVQAVDKDVEHRNQEMREEAALSGALSHPRRPPPPEPDELKRTHTPPRRPPP